MDAGLPIPSPVESNPVTITVGEPIPNWERLRDAGIVLAVMTRDVKKMSKSGWSRDQIEQELELSGRPWMLHWIEYARKEDDAIREMQQR